MDPDWKTEWLAAIQIPLANKFISRCNFRGRIRSHDQCIVMRNQPADIIAVAALRPVDGYQLLTAVAVDPNYQGQGCAKQLLSDMRKRFDDSTYTFSLDYLQDLYQQLGFHSILPTDLPEDLRQRFHAYEKQGRRMIPMVFRTVN